MIMFDPMYFLYVAPAFLLMLWAQWRVKVNYAKGNKIDAHLSGAAAAQYILEKADVYDVRIETTPGHLSDHYDPSSKTLRLSPEVYNSRSATAVGIAAHEAGHALQHAKGYAPLVLRNVAVPVANFGGKISNFLLMGGVLLMMIGQYSFGRWAVIVGIIAFSAVLIFQLINLPVEFDASNRAKRILTEYQIVDAEGAYAVRKVLNAAGWTYVAATLSSLMNILYYALRVAGVGGDD